MSWSLDTAASQQTTASNPSMPLVSTGVGTILNFQLIIGCWFVLILFLCFIRLHQIHIYFTTFSRTAHILNNKQSLPRKLYGIVEFTSSFSYQPAWTVHRCRVARKYPHLLRNSSQDDDEDFGEEPIQCQGRKWRFCWRKLKDDLN